MKRCFAAMILIALLISMMSGCFLPCSDPLFLYDGPYPMLYEAIQRSVLGISDIASNQIVILEKDSVGRTLYLFLGSTVITSYYFDDWRGKSGEKLVALAIAQSFDSTSVSYYDGKNVIISYTGLERIPDNLSKGSDEQSEIYSAQSIANQIFGKEKIEELKLANDWNYPTSTQQEYTIAGKVTEPLSDEQINAAFSPLAEHYHTNFLNVDAQGSSIYLLINTDTRKFFLVFIDANGTIPETGLKELWNIWNYAEELQRFKSDNGWNVLEMP